MQSIYRQMIIQTLITFLLISVSQAKKTVDESVLFNIELMTSGEEFSFDKKMIEAPIGKKIKLKYTNKMNQQGVFHNIAVVKLDKEKELFKNLKKINYDLKKIDKRLILAMTKELKYGESDTVEFLPDQSGIYVYVCLMPGHGDMMGMRGELKIVTKNNK